MSKSNVIDLRPLPEYPIFHAPSPAPRPIVPPGSFFGDDAVIPAGTWHSPSK